MNFRKKKRENKKEQEKEGKKRIDRQHIKGVEKLKAKEGDG